MLVFQRLITILSFFFNSFSVGSNVSKSRPQSSPIKMSEPVGDIALIGLAVMGQVNYFYYILLFVHKNIKHFNFRRLLQLKSEFVNLTINKSEFKQR